MVSRIYMAIHGVSYTQHGHPWCLVYTTWPSVVSRIHMAIRGVSYTQHGVTSINIIILLFSGAVNEILGIDGQPEVALDTDITSWGGTIVTPGQEAYNKEEHKKESMLDEEPAAEEDEEKKDDETEEAVPMET